MRAVSPDKWQERRPNVGTTGAGRRRIGRVRFYRLTRRAAYDQIAHNPAQTNTSEAAIINAKTYRAKLLEPDRELIRLGALIDIWVCSDELVIQT
jgi:hypothetical protein